MLVAVLTFTFPNAPPPPTRPVMSPASTDELLTLKTYAVVRVTFAKAFTATKSATDPAIDSLPVTLTLPVVKADIVFRLAALTSPAVLVIEMEKPVEYSEATIDNAFSIVPVKLASSAGLAGASTTTPPPPPPPQAAKGRSKTEAKPFLFLAAALAHFFKKASRASPAGTSISSYEPAPEAKAALSATSSSKTRADPIGFPLKRTSDRGADMPSGTPARRT